MERVKEKSLGIVEFYRIIFRKKNIVLFIPLYILNTYISFKCNTCVLQAKEESLKRYLPQKHTRGLVTTTLGLHLPLDAETVLNGAVSVRCMAAVSPVMWTSDNEKVLSRQDKREALLLGNNFTLISNRNKNMKS